MYIAEIIGVGSELLYGETLDTNTADLAHSLRPYALRVDRTLRVADDLPVLTAELAQAWSRARLVVISGGLGPTADDITREAIAQLFNETLEIDPQALAELEAFFTARGRTMAPVNRKQASKIASARWLANPRGTAPGWVIERDQKTLVALPGPPAEWKPMWSALLPQLNLPAQYFFQKTFKTWGIGESDIAAELGELFHRQAHLEVGTYAKASGVEVVVRGHTSEAAQLASQIQQRLAGRIWGQDSDQMAAAVIQRLAAQKASLATMESLTGGLIGSLLTEIPGSSAVYAGGMVSYSREAKASFGVAAEILQQYGTVSAPAAEDMARAAQRSLGSTYALATTGVAGPDPLEGQPVGTVFIGLVGPQRARAVPLRLPPVSRQNIRLRTAYTALALLLDQLG